MPVHRHLTIWGIIVLSGLLFAGELVRGTSFSMAGGLIPMRVRAAADSLAAGEFNVETAKALGTVVSSIFLHADVEHILLNLAMIWTFGILLSELLGQWRTLAVFLFCGICGAILHMLLNRESTVPMIGASGALMGLEGAYLGIALRWQLPDARVWPLAYPVPPIQLGVFAVLGFMLDLYLLANREQHIAVGAHLGGFLSGLLIAAIITTIYPTLYKYERASREDSI